MALFTGMTSRPVACEPLVRNPGVHTLTDIFNKKALRQMCLRSCRAFAQSRCRVVVFLLFFFQDVNVLDCIIIVIIIHHRLGYMHW